MMPTRDVIFSRDEFIDVISFHAAIEMVSSIDIVLIVFHVGMVYCRHSPGDDQGFTFAAFDKINFTKSCFHLRDAILVP